MLGEQIVSGMVLASSPIGETDKRVVLLTREEGKMSVFARGARRMNSALTAASMPFAFGTFTVYRGKSTVGIQSANIKKYFTEITEDIDALWYGSYFLEVAEYNALEGADETERLNLLYVTLLALAKKKMPRELIRWIYELRTLTIGGEYPNVFSCVACGKEEELTHISIEQGGSICRECAATSPMSDLISGSTMYTLQYIISAPLEKLYSFRITEDVQDELIRILKKWKAKYVPHRYKSEDFLRLAE